MTSSPHIQDTDGLPAMPPVDRVELRRLALPLTEAMRTGHGSIPVRTLTVVGVRAGGIWGWGECAALPEPTYSPEWAAGAFDVLARWLGPGHGDRTTALSFWFDQSQRVPADRRPEALANPMALAAVELAVLDLRLTLAGRSLAHWLGATRGVVPAGATLGLLEPGEAVSRAEHLVDAGYRRIKCKIVPTGDRELVSAMTRSPILTHPQVSLQLDANGTYDPAEHHRLVTLARLGPAVIEQPFPVDQPDAARRLIGSLHRAGLTTLVMADEASIDAPTTIELARTGAATAITVKPSRLGGLGPTVTVLEACHRSKVPVAAGGMIESGLGRHALAAVAARDECSITGDLSPARRWLARDPWPDLQSTRRPDDGGSDPPTPEPIPPGMWLRVPAGPGVAPLPDPDLLAHLTEALLVY